MSLIACSSEAGGVNGGAADAGGSLGEPSAVFAEDFGTIQTVREVAGGVLVADPLGGALYLVDMDAGTRTVIGTEGQGPGEYLQPDAVWPLPGDSTLLVDLGNGRMITLGPDLEFGPTSPLSAGSPRSGGMVVAIPQAVDGNGNVYARSMGGMGAQLPDSGSVLRIERGALTFESVATFKLEDRTRTTSGSADNQNVSIQSVPLSPEDSWGVASDGSVVVARSDDYHIEWLSPDGTVTGGTAVPFDPIAIGSAEKEEWSRARGQSGGGIGIRIEMNDGAMQTSFARGGMGDGEDENLDQYDWPETKPPFYAGRLVVDSQDRVWVRRHVEAGENTTYDVFNRSAELVATYALPNNKLIVGFGTASVYVVAFDEFDLNYLERFDMPAM
jgi:hypothetical protein